VVNPKETKDPSRNLGAPPDCRTSSKVFCQDEALPKAVMALVLSPSCMGNDASCVVIS